MTTILVTGFGPFPGAPFNPTGPLAARLKQLRRPSLAEVTIVTHVFPTSYAAVDRDLPELIAQAQAGRAADVRARRAHARAADRDAGAQRAGAHARRRRRLVATRIDQRSGCAATRPLPAPGRHLLAAARRARLPVTLSHDAGKYLCNYLIWRGIEAAGNVGGPRLVAFVHVPAVPRTPRRRAKHRPRFSLQALTRAGTQVLMTLVSAARR